MGECRTEFSVSDKLEVAIFTRKPERETGGQGIQFPDNKKPRNRGGSAPKDLLAHQTGKSGSLAFTRPSAVLFPSKWSIAGLQSSFAGHQKAFVKKKENTSWGARKLATPSSALQVHGHMKTLTSGHLLLQKPGPINLHFDPL